MKKNISGNSLETLTTDRVPVIAGKAAESALDISEDTRRIIEMTPKDGFQKKLELITAAQDMSTPEKLAAIDAAEDKYAQDLANNADLYRGMMWTKVGLVLTCTAGIVLMISSPDGRKVARAILKMVA